jgi:hypothetical protein
MINLFTLIYGHFEGVDNLDFTTILSPKESAKDYSAMRLRNPQRRIEGAPKGNVVLVCSRRRVRCSEIFRIGSGCLE